MTPLEPPVSKPAAPISQDAQRRRDARDAERQRLHAAALRVNLQRRKAQARERASGSPAPVDGSGPTAQKGPSVDVNQEPRES